jgi:glycine C-acetyltransferase
VLDLLTQTKELRERLHSNTGFFREQMIAAGFDILKGEHPIVPVMLGDASLAAKMSEQLLQRGVYVVGFSFPVVPKGKARIRVQMSAAHSREDLEFAVAQFAAVKAHL